MSSSQRHPSCVLATCCVPWDDRLQFAEETFRRLVRRLAEAGLEDLYVFGTAGEGYAVTETQFDQITRVFLDETGKLRARAMIGLISLSLPVVIERIERARDLGARRFQISLPSWGALRDAEVATFFQETCGRFPDCEFLHYNLARAGRLLTGAEYGRLAQKHPNLIATKNSTADEARLHSLFHDAPQLRHFITETGYAKASRLGEPGFLVSIASIQPALALAYFNAGKEKDFAALAALDTELHRMVARMIEIAAQGTAHMDGAYDKMFCRLLLPDFPLRLLPPYEPMSESTFQAFTAFLRAEHPRWLS